MIRNMQETKEEGQGKGGEEEEPKKAEEKDTNNKTVTEKRIASTNQRKRQVRVYEEDDDSVEEDERIPIIRIRGRARGEAEEEEEEDDEEDEEDERYVFEDRDKTVAIPIGGRMGEPKIPGMIRISGCNPNGIKTNQLQCHLQHSKDLQIDIQCYSEVNRNFLRTDVRQFFYEGTKRMDRSARGTKNGSNKLGRWSYQLLDGQYDKDIFIICVYHCCKTPTKPKGMTAYHQQEILLSKMDRTDTEP
jgi:hypothetical protein